VTAARVAVIGAGYFAAHQVQAWQDLGAEVVAIADLDPARAQALAARFGIARHGSDTTALLDSSGATVVDVVLPPVAQGEVVRLALGRGLATICQKPFAGTLAEASDLAGLARATGLPLVVHENFRFAPWFRECRRLLDSGHLGRVHGASFRLRPGDGQGAAAYLDRQPSFRTMPQLLVRETAVHFIDCFRYLLGEVRAVTARLRRLNPAIVGEDAGLAIFEFDDECTALFDGNRLNEHPGHDLRRTMGELWLEGEAGVLRLDGDARLWWKPHGAPEHEHGYDRGRADRAFGGAVLALQAHVLAHLVEGSALENAAADYLINLHVQAAVYHSHASGQRVVMSDFEAPLH
jgi:D-apiose dehydrogenase